METIMLCIPRMDSFYTNEFIRKVFENKNIGEIKKIIEIPNKSDLQYKRVILYITLKNNSESAIKIKERFSNKKDVKIIYKEPWFWKVVEATTRQI
jgi:hypothetical protein